ncbi:hypothetical protein BH10PSE18_BH10PSE18_16440 [soil metagenome]
MAMGKIDDKNPMTAATDTSPIPSGNQGGTPGLTTASKANPPQRAHRSFSQVVSDWAHGNRHRHLVEAPMFSARPALPTQLEKSRTNELGDRIAKKLAGPIVGTAVFHRKQHDKKEDRDNLARSAPQGTTAAPVRIVLPDSPLADALETAKTVTRQAVDAAHDLRHGISVELNLIDSLAQLHRFEQVFAGALAPLQDARATLAGLKLSVEENVAPEAMTTMNDAFARADRIVNRERRQTRQLVAAIDQRIASLKTELSQPNFDVANAHPEIFSPIARPSDHLQAGHLLMERQRQCAGRALECATHIRSAPDAAEKAQLFSDYTAFVAAARDMQTQLKSLLRKSIDPVLAERMQLSERSIKGTLHAAKIAAAPYKLSADAALITDTAVNRNVPADKS